MTEEQTDRRRWIALYVLCVGMLMIVLDATIVNVALPSIKAQLGFTQSDLAWVLNAYLIAFGGFLLLAGRLGDLIGQRRVFLIGLGVFTAASLLCGLAGSQGMLIGARFLQGLGGALTSAVILGMIVTMFPERREQAKAIGVFSFVASAGSAIGLLVGGVLTEAISWHWIFFVNVPIGLITALLALRLVDARKGIGLSQGADLPGATLVTSGLMLAVYTILGVGEAGWGSLQTIGLGALSIALVAGFFARQARIPNPLMPLRLFRSRTVTGSNAVMLLMTPGFFGLFFLGALYLQGLLGYSPLEVGLAFLPASIVMGVLSLGFAERLVVDFGARRTLVSGLAAGTLSLLLLARAPLDAVYMIDVLAPIVLLGVGAGLMFPALMTLAMEGASDDDAGLASGLINTTAQVGGAVGLALLATVASAVSLGRESADPNVALNAGYHVAFLIGAALMVAGITVALRALPRDRAAEGGRESEQGVESEPAYHEAA
ncbi:MAG: MFS transporter [Thermoleophilaceae bacterium]|nr:MFS transporter [Thermoleophilaceae bacterium]